MNTNAEIPRKEYPRPQFFRPAWQTLNGQWSCVFGQTDSGRDNIFFESRGFEKIINVPFAPESKLSGIGYTDFINGIWYHRKITIPANWQGKEVMLHFGGVNYNCIVYMDGREIARHTGGSSPFSVNITGFADNNVIIKPNINSSADMVYFGGQLKPDRIKRKLVYFILVLQFLTINRRESQPLKWYSDQCTKILLYLKNSCVSTETHTKKLF